ncbi:SRPBCC family protein [Streptomyces sp. NBC_01498]|uniref:SRPBCC family protein n=1 Tax=Streptomyces sp. NBC_01498 TaxID=2975870 RepID=UPI002E7B8DC0|nr:SRPBCC family protein [Streptomyces sp. NBC_01498]WTL28246.1 SRPBCC family protein [Streptomyces sp. NBC_01498]
MSAFRITRRTELPADEAWRRITDWPAHGRRVPLTRVLVETPGPTRIGTVFVARTGLGRLGFDDPMEVVRWEPPAPGHAGRCRLEKRGRVVLGWAEIEVTAADGAGGARVCWTEELRVAFLPRLVDRVTARTGQAVFGRVVDGLLRDRGRGAGA